MSPCKNKTGAQRAVDSRKQQPLSPSPAPQASSTEDGSVAAAGGGQAHCLPRHRLPCLLLARPLQRARPAAAATIPRPSSSSPSR